MKAKILKLAGVKSEAEFYKLYPTEESFMKVHGHKLMNKYGPGGATTDGCGRGFDKDPVTGKCVPNDMYDVFNYKHSRPANESNAIIFNRPRGPVSTATTGQTKEQMANDAKAMGKFKKRQRDDEKKEILQRKAAVAAKDKGEAFTLPTGESKTYENMNTSEQSYVDGLALNQRFRFFPNENSFFDNWINFGNLLGNISGGLAKAPYEAKLSDSYVPYLTSVGNALLAGRLAGSGSINPLGSKFWTNEVSNRAFLNNLAGGIPGMVEGATKIGSRAINKVADKLANIPFNKSQGISSKFIPQELEQIPFEYVHPETGESTFVNSSQSNSALPSSPVTSRRNYRDAVANAVAAGRRWRENQNPILDTWRTIENQSQTGNIVPKIVKNKSGLTKEEVLQKVTSKDKDVVSKMTEQEFENTVLKPTGEIVNYQPAPVVDAISLTDDEYMDLFNQNIDLFNNIIQQNNKSGLQYTAKGLQKGHWGPELVFETPPQYVVPEITPKMQESINQFRSNPKEFLIQKANLRQNPDGTWETDTFAETFQSLDDIIKKVEDELAQHTEPKTISGESKWDVGLKPGQWKGEVQDVASTEYYQDIPGLSMRNTSNSVFSDGMPRRGTGTYDALNEYLKRLDLGRVKPGFNSQTKYSLGAWENFIKKDKAVGFYARPDLVYGTMKTVLPYAVPTAIGLTALDNATSNDEETLPQQAYGGPLADYYAGKMNHGQMFKDGGLVQYGPGGATTDGCKPGYSKDPSTGQCIPNGWKSNQLGAITTQINQTPILYNQPTASDSLNLYNRALQIADHYKSKGYTRNPIYEADAVKDWNSKQNQVIESVKNDKKLTNRQRTERIKSIKEYDKKLYPNFKKRHAEYYKNVNAKKFPDYLEKLQEARQAVTRTKGPLLYNDKSGNVFVNVEDDNLFKLPYKPFDYQNYYRPLNKNQFEQRELSFGFLDLSSPTPIYDRRIVPQNLIVYRSPKDAGYSDAVELYEYDPLAVKPYAMRTPEEKIQWEELYGDKSKKSTPTQQPVSTQEVVSTNTVAPIVAPVQQNRSAPKGDYIFGPGNSVIGVVNNGVFTKVDMPEQRGGVNKADLDLLNNEEALRKYVQQKGLKYAKGGLVKAQDGLWNNILNTPTETKDKYGYTFLQPNSSKLPQGYVVPYNTPSTELAQSVGGDNIPQYDVSYWDTDKKNWNLKTFKTEKESNDFTNQMSARRLGSPEGNITQTKRYVKNGPAFLIPGFKGGKKLENPLQEFKDTKEHLGGPFKTWQEAENFEKLRHKYVEKGQSIPTPLLPYGQEYAYANGGSVREKAIYPTGTRQPLSLNAIISQNRTDRDNNSYSGGISKFAKGGQANRFYYNEGYGVPKFYGGGPYANTFAAPNYGTVNPQQPQSPGFGQITVGNPNAFYNTGMQQPMNYGSMQVGNPQNSNASQPGWSYNRNNPNGNTQRASDGKNETFGKVLAGLGMVGMVAGAIGGLGKKKSPCGEGTIWDEKTRQCKPKPASSQQPSQQPFQQPLEQPSQQDNFQLGKSLGQAMNNDQGIAWNYNPNIQATQIQSPTDAPSDSGPSSNSSVSAAASTARYGGDIFRSRSKSRKYSKFAEGGLTGPEDPYHPLTNPTGYRDKNVVERLKKLPNKEERYEPSQLVNDVKAGLSAWDMATSSGTQPWVQAANWLARVANSKGDGYTALRYAMDGQWGQAGIDAAEAILDAIPWAKKQVILDKNVDVPKGKLQFTKLGKAQNALLKAGKAGAQSDDFMHSSIGRFLFGNPDSKVKYNNGGDISIPQLPTKNSPLLQFYYNNI